MDIDKLYEISPSQWPDDAASKIRDMLSDKEASRKERLTAAKLAAEEKVLNDEMADVLLDILHDDEESEELRCIAVEAFGPALQFNGINGFYESQQQFFSEKKFYEIKKTLRDFYYDIKLPKTLRRRILEADVCSPMQWHKNAIKRAYESDDEEWILSAIFGMGYVKGYKKQILESLESSNPEIVYEAVCAAGNAGVKEAWPVIKDILSSPQEDNMLLRSAISAAPFINNAEAEEFLTQLLENEDEDIAEAAEIALMYNSDEFEDDTDTQLTSNTEEKYVIYIDIEDYFKNYNFIPIKTSEPGISGENLSNTPNEDSTHHLSDSSYSTRKKKTKK